MRSKPKHGGVHEEGEGFRGLHQLIRDHVGADEGTVVEGSVQLPLFRDGAAHCPQSCRGSKNIHIEGKGL